MEQQNKYHVIVSERATQMLVSHAAFLAQVSPEAAERLTAEFEKAANSLELMPQRCPWLTGEYIPRNAYRFILFEKRYMIIFQIVDDILDVEGDPEKTGKSHGQDEKNNKTTYVSLAGMDKAKEDVQWLTEDAMGILSDLPESSTFLKELMQYLTSREA